MPTHLSLPNVRGLPLLQVYQFLTNNTTIQSTSDELAAKGWIPLIQSGLVGISTSGYLVWTGATAGGRNVTEINSTTLSSYCSVLPGVMAGALSGISLGLAHGSGAPGSAAANYAVHRIYLIPITTDGAGAMAALTIQAAVASYKHRMLLKLLFSNVSVVAGTILTFTNGDGTALAGASGGTITMGAITAGVVQKDIDGLLLYDTNANKSTRVAITNGPISCTGVIQIEYWLEA